MACYNGLNVIWNARLRVVHKAILQETVYLPHWLRPSSQGSPNHALAHTEKFALWTWQNLGLEERKTNNFRSSKYRIKRRKWREEQQSTRFLWLWTWPGDIAATLDVRRFRPAFNTRLESTKIERSPLPLWEHDSIVWWTTPTTNLCSLSCLTSHCHLAVGRSTNRELGPPKKSRNNYLVRARCCWSDDFRAFMRPHLDIVLKNTGLHNSRAFRSRQLLFSCSFSSVCERKFYTCSVIS